MLVNKPSIMASQRKVGIIGSGLIGRSWAMLFAGAGFNVVMYDVDSAQLDGAKVSIKQQLNELERQGLLRGTLLAEEQFFLISTSENLSEAVKDAIHIQECVPENVDLKKQMFSKLNDLCTLDETVLCSSTSCILPSKIFTGLRRVSQCIVAHPCNPPYHCPLTEIIPHPETSEDAVQRTRELMAKIGQEPVMVKREIDGFALNRMQYAIINEAWRLVEDGIMTPEDVDKVFTTGLGMRYAFIGPFETIHLNAEGTENYMQRYASSIRRVSSSFGPIPTFDGKTLEHVEQRMASRIPSVPDELNKRRQWRDDRLVALAKLKKQMDS